MSYDIRNQPTATSLRTAANERLNYLSLRAKLNKDYEDAQFERKENERLNIEPAIPVYRSKDEMMADLTTQRQLLKLHLASVMNNDQAQKFIGHSFKNPEYAVLTNEYWSDIEPLVSQFRPITSQFLIEWLNRYFLTKQKMGTEINTVVDPDKFGDLNDINKKATELTTGPRLSDDQIKQSVREIMNRNYNFNIPAYSTKLDNDIKDFYIQQKVIAPTKKLTMADWNKIYNKEIKGFNSRIGAFVPKTAFSYSGFKKGSELPGQIGAEEAAKFASQEIGQQGTMEAPINKEDATAEETPRLPQMSGLTPGKAPGVQTETMGTQTGPTESQILATIDASANFTAFKKNMKDQFKITGQEPGKLLLEIAESKGIATYEGRKKRTYNDILLDLQASQGGEEFKPVSQLSIDEEAGFGFRFGKNYISKHSLKKKS